MFFITEGKAALYLDASDPAKGAEQKSAASVVELGAGEIVGEMSLVENEEAIGHVVALDVSEAFYLSCEAFDAIYKEHEEFAEKIRVVMDLRRTSNEARKVKLEDGEAAAAGRIRGQTAGSGVAAVLRLLRIGRMANTASRMRVHVNADEAAPQAQPQAMSSSTGSADGNIAHARVQDL